MLHSQMLHSQALHSQPIETGAAGVSIEAVTAPGRLAALVRTVERAGLAADRVGVRSLARAAQDQGISAVLVSVMVDEAEPEVARIRAFGRVSAAMDVRLQLAS